MTPDEARKVARELAAFANKCCDRSDGWEDILADRFTAALLAAAAQQREEDARVVERHVLQATDDEAGLARAIKYIAAAIRGKP